MKLKRKTEEQTGQYTDCTYTDTDNCRRKLRMIKKWMKNRGEKQNKSN